MSRNQEYEKMYIAFIVFGILILVVNIYYFCHPLLSSVGLSHEVADHFLFPLRNAGYFSGPYKTKIAAMAVLMLCCLVRSGKGKKVEPITLTILGLVSLFCYYFPFDNPLFYLIATLIGAAGLILTFAMIGRYFMRFNEHGNDLRESFEQESAPVEGEYSIIFPTKYFYRKKYHNGYISVVNPFRGTLIVGSAGSGKSFSIFNPFIEQMIEKGFTMMLYDFKMPDLSKIVYNALIKYQANYKIKPQFYCINFKDPIKSNRCNPIAAEYLTDIIDASETARVVMEALNKGNEKKDFFWMSAQQYIGICLWFLRIYTPPQGEMGAWCDFPHLIELINQDYKRVLEMVKHQPTLDGKARVFIDALEANAQDQLQGQIASARIPLNDIASPALYWVLSGNDFSLDINDPKKPKILCVGNDPDRQQVYGAALSLFTFRVIKRVNKPGQLPCGIIMDELPTISVQGLDGLMATARSNKVAVVLGVQDVSQITADYGEKVAEKIIALPANVFVGSSSIKTAEKYSKEFGKEFRRQESQTQSIDSESLNISYHEEEIMPIRKITSLPQGTFIGKVAVDNTTPMAQPFFCGSIQIDMAEDAKKRASAQELPDLSDFGLGKLIEELKKPEVRITYLKEYIAEKVFEDWKTNKTFRIYDKKDSKVSEEVNKIISSMEGSEQEKIVQDLIPGILQRKVDEVIQQNYDVIKDDIKQLIRMNGQLPEEYEEDDVPVQEMEEVLMLPDGEGENASSEMEVTAQPHLIDDLHIRERYKTILRNAGITTLEQISNMTSDELLNINQVGGKLKEQIVLELKYVGLSLKKSGARKAKNKTKS